MGRDIELTDTEQALADAFRVGRSFWVRTSHRGSLYHIRAVVDNEYVVTKHWTKSRWAYKLEHIYYLLLLLKSGTLVFKR